MPRHSIIIPCFNKERFVEETLQSCLDQTDRDFEVIVVDDVSTDDSVKIVKKMMAKDARIKLIQQKRRQGPSIARNVGVKAAKGKYINYLDADDIIEPQKLELQGKILDKHKKVGIVLAKGITIDDRGKIMDRKYVVEGQFRGHPPLQDLLFRGGLFPPAAMLCRRKDVLKIGGFWPKGYWCEDLEFFIRLARTGVDYHLVPQPLFRYRRSSGSWGSNQKRMEQGYRDPYAKLMREDPEQSARGLRFVNALLGYAESRIGRGTAQISMAILLKLVGQWHVAQAAGKPQKIMIWGAGSGGQRILAILRALGVQAAAFIDRDPAKIGTKVEGLPIIGPAEVVGGTPKTNEFVVVASTFAEQIKRELQKAKWTNNENFYVFDFDMALTLENVLDTDPIAQKMEDGKKAKAAKRIKFEPTSV